MTFVTKSEQVISNQWDGLCYHSFTNSSHSRGVSVFISDKSSIKVENVKRDEVGRRLLINIVISDSKPFSNRFIGSELYTRYEGILLWVQGKMH